MSHLTDAQIQGLADGTLRGPAGLAARDHCEICPDCEGELALFMALAGRLSSLRDPELPPDFTTQVMAAVEAREAHLQQRRHTLLAALPAAALALLSIVGWALSTAPEVHVDRAIESATAVRHVVGVLGPVLTATRLPLGLAALAFLVAVSMVLARTLRAGSAPRAAAS